jgi:DNA-binding Lrp family transcriptional regulator
MAFAFYPGAWMVAAELALPPTVRLVLLFLADVTNPEGVSWYSQTEIAKATGLSARTVRGALKRLEEEGVIERSPRHLGATKARTSDLVFLLVPKSGAEGNTAGAEGAAAGVRRDLPEDAARAADEPRKEPRTGTDLSLRKEEGEEKVSHTYPVAEGDGVHAPGAGESQRQEEELAALILAGDLEEEARA